MSELLTMRARAESSVASDVSAMRVSAESSVNGFREEESLTVCHKYKHGSYS